MPDSFNFTPNLPGMTYGGYPPELQQEAQKLARQQAIADAMLARNMQPGPQGTQMVSGIAVRNSPLAGINQMLAPYLGQYVQEGLDKERTALGEKYSTQLGAAVRDYTQRTTGTPEIEEPSVELGGGPGRPAMPATDEEKRAAIISAMSSGFGPLQRIAGEDWKQLQKNQLLTKDIGNFMKDFTPESVQAFVRSGGKTPLERRPELMAAGDYLLDKNASIGQKPVPIRTFEPPRSVPTAAGQPPAFLQRDPGTGKETSLGGGGTTVNVDTGGDKVQVAEERKMMVEGVKASHQEAQDATKDITTLQTANEALREGIRAGTLQNWQQEFDKALVTMGITDNGKQVANTDTFMRTMANRILSYTKELRPLSDTDRKYLEGIKSGNNLTVDGLKKLLDIGMEANLTAIDKHSKLLNRYPAVSPGFREQFYVPIPKLGNVPGVSQMEIGPKTPTSQRDSTPAPQTPSSLDEAAKAAGGKRL